MSSEAFLRSTSPAGRVVSLLAGFGLSVLIDTIAPTLYWLENGWVNVAGAVTVAIIFMLIVFLPALIGLFRRFTKLENRGTAKFYLFEPAFNLRPNEQGPNGSLAARRTSHR